MSSNYTKAKHDLLAFFSNKHGLILTDGDINDILAAVEVYQSEMNTYTVEYCTCKHPHSFWSFKRGDVCCSCGKPKRNP